MNKSKELKNSLAIFLIVLAIVLILKVYNIAFRDSVSMFTWFFGTAIFWLFFQKIARENLFKSMTFIGVFLFLISLLIQSYNESITTLSVVAVFPLVFVLWGWLVTKLFFKGYPKGSNRIVVVYPRNRRGGVTSDDPSVTQSFSKVRAYSFCLLFGAFFLPILLLFVIIPVIILLF